jgi:hypothetical protein
VPLVGLLASPANGAVMKLARAVGPDTVSRGFAGWRVPAAGDIDGVIAQNEHAGEISNGSSFLSVGDSSFWRRS